MTHMPPMSPNMHRRWTIEIRKLESVYRELDSARIMSGNYKYPATVLNELKRIRNLLDVIIYAHEEDAA